MSYLWKDEPLFGMIRSPADQLTLATLNMRRFSLALYRSYKQLGLPGAADTSA